MSSQFSSFRRKNPIHRDARTGVSLALEDRLPPGKMLFNYKKNRAWAENLSIVMQIGLTMAGCIVFCFFVGLYLDKWIGTKGIFVTIFTILGVIGGAVTVYRQILKVIEDKSGSSNDGER